MAAGGWPVADGAQREPQAARQCGRIVLLWQEKGVSCAMGAWCVRWRNRQTSLPRFAGTSVSKSSTFSAPRRPGQQWRTSMISTFLSGSSRRIPDNTPRTISRSQRSSRSCSRPGSTSWRWTTSTTLTSGKRWSSPAHRPHQLLHRLLLRLFHHEHVQVVHRAGHGNVDQVPRQGIPGLGVILGGNRHGR